MMTRIQSLFLVEAAITVASNEDLVESIAFVDTDGAPIPLDGIAFRAIAKTARSSNAAYLGLATEGAFLDLPPGVPRGLFLTTGNVLGFYAPFLWMGRRPMPGVFVFDVVAAADGLTRRVVDGSLTIIQGVT